MDVLVVTQAYPSASDLARGASLHASVTAWQARGLGPRVFVVGGGAGAYDGVDVLGGELPALSRLLSETEPHRLVVYGFDERVAHALDRGWRCQATPIVVLCGEDVLFPDAGSFARPYFTRELAAPPHRERLEAFHRYAEDPRVTWVFRSEWHRSRARALLGASLSRSTVIPPGVGAEFSWVARAAEARTRVVFSRRFDDECRRGVDLFVHTVIALSKQPGFERFDFLVLGDGPRHEALLAPLVRFTNVKIERGFLPQHVLARRLLDRGVALLPTRYATHDRFAAQAAAAGLVVVSGARGGVPELIPETWGTLARDDDPAEYAAILQRLAASPEVFLDASKALAAHVATVCGPAQTFERELELVREPLARPVHAPGPAARAPELTVVVPAYNTGHQLSRCVESLARFAPAGEVELLVVDDGSTDETPAIARGLVERWPGYVRVITQPNKGHGGAVNTGLREARGRYFRVVDADDWVDSRAFAALVRSLPGETADILLTDYAEVTPDGALPRKVELFSRLPVGATTWFDTLTDPVYGLTSWGPILATSTYRTELLARAGLSLSEHSPYVDMEYCTLGLTYMETLRYTGLDVYRYSVGAASQSVSAAGYLKGYRQHEAVILRLCNYVRDTPLSEAKRRYIVDRVLLAIIGAHFDVLTDLVRRPAELRAFEAKLEGYRFLAGALAARRGKGVRSVAVKRVKAVVRALRGLKAGRWLRSRR